MSEKKKRETADAELAGTIAEQLLKKYGIIKKGIAAREGKEEEPVVKRKSRAEASIKAVEKVVKEVEQDRAIRSRRKRKAATEVSSDGVPIWGEHVFGAPNELIRSALFAAIEARHGSFRLREVIMEHGDTVISFTGRQLTQAHMDVYEGVMHFLRGSPEGTRVNFKAYQILKLIGRQTGKNEYAWLEDMLHDLVESIVSIRDRRGKFFRGALISSTIGDIHDGDFSVEITRYLVNLFNRGFTTVEWEQRWKLKRKPLACWLQLYYCSHSEPFPITVEFLRAQSGSKTADLSKFRQSLKAALDEIKEIGVIDSWEIGKGDKVTVIRPKSKKTKEK